MKSVAGLAFATTLLLSACAPGFQVPAAAQDKTLSPEQRLDVLVPPLLDQHRVPGAAVAIIDGDRTLVRGYGLQRAASPEAIGPDTVFEAASLGKPLFAYAMMKREAAGGLDLDKPLSASLDEPFVKGDERLHRVTARLVLSHTTGWPNWRPRRFTGNPGALRFRRDPGRKFGYSGEGYMYLQAVAEQQTGEALDGLMGRLVLEPLAMSRTGYRWSAAFESDFAHPHDARAEADDKWRPTKAGAAYSLHTTARDYARFLEEVLADDSGIVEAMLMPQIEASSGAPLAWSLGWGIETRADGDWFWHWGDNPGFKHFVMGSRAQGRAILVLTNGERGPRLYRAIVETMLGFLPEALDFGLIHY